MELIAHLGEREETVRLERADSGYRVIVGERTYDVDVAAAGDGAHSLVIAGRQVEVSVARDRGGRYRVTAGGDEAVVELVDPLTYLAQKAHAGVAGDGPQQVTAYMPGRVVEILAAEGDTVEPGQGVLVLEAMKMKNEIPAESGGVVRRILVETGQAVEGGDPLFEIGPQP